jgi:hypothetical protein
MTSRYAHDLSFNETAEHAMLKLPRRKFLHLAAGAAALSAVSRLAWACDSCCLMRLAVEWT